MDQVQYGYRPRRRKQGLVVAIVAGISLLVVLSAINLGITAKHHDIEKAVNQLSGEHEAQILPSHAARSAEHEELSGEHDELSDEHDTINGKLENLQESVNAINLLNSQPCAQREFNAPCYTDDGARGVCRDGPECVALPISPATGCAFSSPELGELVDTILPRAYDTGHGNTIFLINVFSGGSLAQVLTISPERLVEWPDLSPENFDALRQNVFAYRDSFTDSVSLPGLFEDERSQLAHYGSSIVFSFADPLTILYGSSSYLSYFPIVTDVYNIAFSLPGLVPTDNILDMMEASEVPHGQIPNLLEQKGRLENRVFSVASYDEIVSELQFAQLVYQNPDSFLRPVMQPTPSQDARLVDISNRLTQKIQDIIDYIDVDGPYYAAMESLRPLESPGLGAPGLNEDAKEVYTNTLLFTAQTEKTPQEINQEGLDDVALLQQDAIDTVNELLGTSFTNYTQALDAVRTSEYVRQRSFRDIKNLIETDIFRMTIDQYKAFQFFPRASIGVRPENGVFGAASYSFSGVEGNTNTIMNTPGYYNFPIPGKLDDNITQLEYAWASVTAHESIPGHHTQFGIEEELTCAFLVPFLSGASEGWGLYSERVAFEDLIPEDVERSEELLRKLSFIDDRIFRAARLVIDTGLHFYGWSFERALMYFDTAIGLSGPFAESEIVRYIGWPGQAVGYLIGAKKYEQERARAVSELGDDFDLREWHDVLLRLGTPAEETIVRRTNYYIGEKRSGTFSTNWPGIVRQPEKQFPKEINTAGRAALQKLQAQLSIRQEEARQKSLGALRTRLGLSAQTVSATDDPRYIQQLMLTRDGHFP